MKKKILVVDDVEINREILCEILEDEYDVIQAENGVETLEKVEMYKDEISVILLDLVMPVMDGFAVLDTLKAKKYMERIPVLVISGESSVSSERRCRDYGVSDFIHKPFNDMLVQRRISNTISVFNSKNELADRVKEQTEEIRKQNLALQAQADLLKSYNNTIVDILGTVVESRNLEIGEHIQRVKGYTRILAEQIMKDHPELGLTEEYIEVLVSASALHDVGKIAIPDNILLKPGRLTDEEFEIIKTHTTLGCELINSIEGAWDDEYKKTSYDICRYHHERFDGRGYPDKLKGDEIPLSARIVSIADVYDALTSKRVYKDAYGRQTAFNMILNGECGTFSPMLLTSFENAREKFESFNA